MDTQDYRTVADFEYLTSDGRRYRVSGGALDDRMHGRRPVVLGFEVVAFRPNVPQSQVGRFYHLAAEISEMRDRRVWIGEAEFDLTWALRSLRRFAVEDALREIEAGTLSNSGRLIESSERHLLLDRQHRLCEFQEASGQDLICTRGVSGARETTLAVCDTCAMPDLWERCAHVRHTKTHVIRTDQSGVQKRECSGMCDLGKDPGGLIPYLCRAAGGGPDCFAPGLLSLDIPFIQALLGTKLPAVPTTGEQPAMYEYEVALSFAGEDRASVEPIAAALKGEGVRVFYDKYERAALWGKDGYQHFADVYNNKARYCVVFVSQAYAAKVWPSHELRSAQARALRERQEYILPVRMDSTKLPGLHETIMYLPYDPDEIVRCVLAKLGRAP